MDIRFNLRFLAIVVGFFLTQSAATETLTVRYPAVQDPYYSQRDVYFVKLLEMALAESSFKVDIEAVKFPPYSENRSVLFLKANDYDVHWMNTNAEREQEVAAIKVPLDKGIIGWRALFIKEGMQETFNSIDTVDKLQKFVFVQGHDWADIDILRHNALKVQGVSNWLGLFEMVKLNRADIFPRSIVEIVEENNSFGDGLAIEKGLILQYPAAYYFFVNKDNVKLKKALEIGMLAIVENGRLDQLFFETYSPKLAPLNILDRRLLNINRPSLSGSMPLDNKKLWFSIDWYRQMIEQSPIAPTKQ